MSIKTSTVIQRIRFFLKTQWKTWCRDLGIWQMASTERWNDCSLHLRLLAMDVDFPLCMPWLKRLTTMQSNNYCCFCTHIWQIFRSDGVKKAPRSATWICFLMFCSISAAKCLKDRHGHLLGLAGHVMETDSLYKLFFWLVYYFCVVTVLLKLHVLL